MRLSFRMLSVVVCCAASTPAIAALPATSDFEDLPSGFSRSVPDPAFPTKDIQVNTQPFQWDNGTFTNGGTLTAVNRATAAPEFPAGLSSDRILNLNNINADFVFDADADKASINYIDYGGNVNLAINDQFYEADNIIAILIGLFGPGNSSGTINTADGPVRLSATAGEVMDQGQVIANAGTVQIEALGTATQLTRFMIGGQEFYVDNFAAVPEPTAAAPLALGALAALLRRRHLRR